MLLLRLLTLNSSTVKPNNILPYPASVYNDVENSTIKLYDLRLHMSNINHTVVEVHISLSMTQQLVIQNTRLTVVRLPEIFSFRKPYYYPYFPFANSYVYRLLDVYFHSINYIN